MDKEWYELKIINAWNESKFRSADGDTAEEKASNNTVHFASLMDLCHLKHSKLAEHLHMYTGRVVVCGDNVVDDAGRHAVFTEQGASASHETAATVLDVISRVPRIAAEASDAVPAYTQVKVSDATRWLGPPQSHFPAIRTRLLPHQQTNNWNKVEDLVVALERKLFGLPLAGLLGEQTI